MPIAFDRSICCDLNETISREWLVTNGLGGYAAGTVAGVLTRIQHGLLVATSPEITVPQLLLAKIDEEVFFDRRTYYLGTNEYRDGTLNPAGFVHLETFCLQEGFPVFTYRLGGIDGVVLEKRIWMAQGYNTTYIQYRVLRTAPAEKTFYSNTGSLRRAGTTGALNLSERSHEHTEAEQRVLTLTLLPFSACRPYNQSRHEGRDRHFDVQTYRREDGKDSSRYGLPLPPGVAGCTIQAPDSSLPYHLLAVGHPESQVTFLPTGVWYWNFLHRHDALAGHPTTDDLYLPGVIRANLWPDEESTLTIIVSSEELAKQILQPEQLRYSYQQQVERKRELVRNTLQPQRYFGAESETLPAHHLRILPLTTTSDPYKGGEEYLSLLLQAGDHFLIQKENRRTGFAPGLAEHVPVLLTNYYALECSTREALIALPGLTLVTQRYHDARRILYELAQHFKEGMLPDRLPQPASPLTAHDYGSVDTTLWYFYALDHYVRVTHDYGLLEEIFPHLEESMRCYREGTSSGIRVDPADGLLSACQPGRAMTWMNATLHDSPLTSRAGKAVEVNALWYHALMLLLEWSEALRGLRASRELHTAHNNPDTYFSRKVSERSQESTQLEHRQLTATYRQLLDQCRSNFQRRFWNEHTGCLYDVIDGPEGNDASIRPNQLLALSLRHSVLDEDYQQSVFEVVTRHLLTPYGLRTLSPQDTAYRGRLEGNQEQQKRSLHQGSVWSWLLGPYIEAMLTMRCSPSQALTLQDENLCHEYFWRKGLRLLEPFKERFVEGLLGNIEGISDGDAPYQPYRPGENLASASGVGELLRIYDVLAHMRITQPERMFSY